MALMFARACGSGRTVIRGMTIKAKDELMARVWGNLYNLIPAWLNLCLKSCSFVSTLRKPKQKMRGSALWEHNEVLLARHLQCLKTGSMGRILLDITPECRNKEVWRAALLRRRECGAAWPQSWTGSPGAGPSQPTDEESVQKIFEADFQPIA